MKTCVTFKEPMCSIKCTNKSIIMSIKERIAFSNMNMWSKNASHLRVMSQPILIWGSIHCDVSSPHYKWKMRQNSQETGNMYTCCKTRLLWFPLIYRLRYHWSKNLEIILFYTLLLPISLLMFDDWHIFCSIIFNFSFKYGLPDWWENSCMLSKIMHLC